MKLLRHSVISYTKTMKKKFYFLALLVILITIGIIILIVSLSSKNFFYRVPVERIAYLIEKYPNATIWDIEKREATIKGPSGSWINYSTGDSEQEVINFYKERLPKEDWVIKQSPYQNGKIYFSKGLRNIYFENFCTSKESEITTACRRLLITQKSF